MLAVFCTNHVDEVMSKVNEITNEYYTIMSQLLYKTKGWTEDCDCEDEVDFPVPKLSELLVTSEEFLIKQLLEVLWRSEGKLFFNERYERILYLQESKNNLGEAAQLEEEIFFMLKHRNNMDDICETVQESLLLIKMIREALEEESDNYYQDDESDPEVEIWKWILVVPWWRIIFEYKRFKLDQEAKKREMIDFEAKSVSVLFAIKEPEEANEKVNNRKESKSPAC
jgi:hypothetical protein